MRLAGVGERGRGQGPGLSGGDSRRWTRSYLTWAAFQLAITRQRREVISAGPVYFIRVGKETCWPYLGSALNQPDRLLCHRSRFTVTVGASKLRRVYQLGRHCTMTNGGPAFPRPASLGLGGIHESDQTGMSLRDWFAGQALTGAVAASAGETADSSMTATEYAAQLAPSRKGAEADSGVGSERRWILAVDSQPQK